jgi:nucleoid-associated protein YgaU
VKRVTHKMEVKKVLKQVKASESTISMVLGIAAVVIVGIILFNYFRNYSTNSEVGNDVNPAVGNEEVGGNGTLPTKYTVAAGESLWDISEKFYQSGYNWVDISKENNLANPNVITEGQVLVIPKVETKQATLATTEKTVEQPAVIKGDKYTIVEGDTLWDISVRAYQNGYKWVEIAKANSLANPNIIHPGNVLSLPR